MSNWIPTVKLSENPANNFSGENERDIGPLLQDITVKFRIPKSQTVTYAYPYNCTIQEVKIDISEKFQILPKFLILKQTNSSSPLEDEYLLLNICDNNYGIIDIDVELSENALQNNVRLEPQTNYNNFTLPDIITVTIPGLAEGTSSRDLVVEIENQAIIKPFLGGFVDKIKKIEYHDAFTQTGPPLERIKYHGIRSRDTQTVEEKAVEIDTLRSRATVNYGDATEHSYSSKYTDKVIEPKSYESYEEMTKRIDLIGKVTLIQRNFRRYMWQKLIKNSAAEWRRLKKEQKRRETKRIKSRQKEYRKECIVKTFPKTKQDFDALYAQVQLWKENERKEICEKYSGAPKIAELNMLLDKEVQLLNGIERQRQILQQQTKKIRDEQILKKNSIPIKWVGYNNLIIHMDTMRNQRARFLADHYRSLAEETPTIHERITVLNRLSQVVTKENHPATDELKTLFQREKQMLVSNVDGSRMDLLRKRQLNLLMGIITHDDNDIDKKNNTRLCKKCKKVRPIAKFPLDTRQSSASICEKCSDLHGPAIDTAIYRSILRSIRRDEKKRGALSSYAFIIQDNDIKHIVENIWHGHSAISNETNRPELRLPRWNIAKDWSPWNCICLTENEARAHLKIVHLNHYYEEHIIKDIKNKHALSKSAFKQLREIDHVFVESGTWWQVGLDGKTT
ncbi:IQ and ubiquitin-like domain-containing protein [Toxorhynchites rutilus septentrionalis]|uniref:IQ and ubiquitin-like domain-containing protein n=1 Tax=Toxorhynchites rutilus septentrionalis TaxID=329112 RepID=UPI002479BD4A|nr:IQ and ubiquitin-like domain-containing protein [Toxorhynchites rutilus septentrionalis]